MNSTAGFESLFKFSLLLLFSASASVGAPSPLSASTLHGPKCSFSGEDYQAGETWYRHLKTPSADFCVHCLCKEDGRVNCSTVTCNPTLCGKSGAPDCCQVCESRRDKDDLPTQSGVKQHVSCLHNGQVYQDGQTFSSNTTGLQAQQPNQCIQCVCQSGMVLCRLKNCPSSIQCSSPQTNYTDCCPSCKDDVRDMQQSKSSPVLVTIMVADSHSNEEDCTTGGVTYSHGSSWHPVIGPFGQMDCVFCKCQNGKIECSRLNCPSIEKLSCSKPLQMPGQCCPLCMGQNDEPSSVVTERKITFSSQIPNENNKGQRVAGYDGEGSYCLPPQVNTIVYRSQASSSSSGYYQYAFQTMGTNKNTRLLTWTVKDGHIGDFSEQHLSREEFNTLTKTFKFKLQGATRTRFMEKFIRKAKRLPDRCGNRCTTKIQKLELVLQLRVITREEQCIPPEVTFY